YAYATVAAKMAGNFGDGGRELIDALDRDWRAVDREWDRIDLGFFIGRMLAVHSPELARRYLKQAEDIREHAVLDSGASASAHMASVDLAIRVFAGLLPKGIDKPNDLDRLTGLIHRINSVIERTRLLGKLAVRLFYGGRQEAAQRIVVEHIRPA